MGKVAITAAGVNSPIGCSLDEFMNSVSRQVSGIGYIENYDTEYFPLQIGGEVRQKGAVVKTSPEIDRKGVFLKNAMAEVIAGNLDFEDYSPNHRMLNMGVGIDHFDITGFVDQYAKDHPKWENHYQNSHRFIHEIESQYDIMGGSSINVSACVASSQSLGLSYRMIKKKPDSIAITGGCDSMLSALHLMGFYKLGALSDFKGDPKEACKPFDRNRDGLVLGEGGIAFSLQHTSRIKKSHPLAFLCGYGSTIDAYNVTAPHPEGKMLAQSALNAIQEAGITPDEIDCVHLHGTGTPKNALAETGALKIIFPSRFREIPVFSLKAQVGHLIAACGAIELLGVIYSFQEQVVPPTLNYRTPDPQVPLNVIQKVPLQVPIRYILKLNSGFGGQNTALVLKRYE